MVLDYLLYAAKGEQDSFYRVRRRTVRLRHIQTALLIEGIKSGEFPASINVKEANELLYSFIEAAVFRLAVLRRGSVEELKGAMKLLVKRLANN